MEDEPKKKRGRPPGSKNKPKTTFKREEHEDEDDETYEIREKLTGHILTLQNATPPDLPRYSATELERMSIDQLRETCTEVAMAAKNQMEQENASPAAKRDLKPYVYRALYAVEIATHSPVGGQKSFLQGMLYDILGIGDLAYPTSLTQTCKESSELNEAIDEVCEKYRASIEALLSPELVLGLCIYTAIRQVSDRNEAAKAQEAAELEEDEEEGVD